MQDYRALLRIELEDRLARNSNYSKRAFARDLGLSPGHLLYILTGKKKLSADRASTIVERLDWSSRNKKLFMNLVRFDNARNDLHRAIIQKEISTKANFRLIKKLNPKAIQVIGNWYYHAILALCELKDFKNDVTWIAKRLALAPATTGSALTTLIDLDLIEKVNGKLKKRLSTLRIDSIPSRAIREHHRQFLAKAADALETQGFDERDMTGSVFAINPEKLPQAKRAIKAFREEMSSLLDDGDRNSQIYRLSVQLFHLDRCENNKNTDNDKDNLKERKDNLENEKNV